jgi:hypothetical protein
VHNNDLEDVMRNATAQITVDLDEAWNSLQERLLGASPVADPHPHPARSRRRVWVAATLAACAVIGIVVAGVLLQSGDTHAPRHVATPVGAAALPILDPAQVRELPESQRIFVVDHTGARRGFVIHDDLYGQDLTGAVLVRVYDENGDPVGYYGNLVGFVEKSVAEAPGFDQYEILRQRGPLGPMVTEAPR